jgi:predicted dehydrogenase
MVHAPVIAAGPETRLAGVWARREDAASALAARFGVPTFATPEALFEACDAVAFAVPPAVQAELAVRAAKAGKAVLLEKPIAGDLDSARHLVDAIQTAGVVSMVVLSWRYAEAVRTFLAQAGTLAPIGGRGAFISGGLLGGPFATPWRLERGPLVDLGPHVIDLLDAALGRVTRVRAHGDLHGWVGLQLEHESGAVSDASLCATALAETHVAGVEVYGPRGSAAVDCGAAVGVASFATLRAEFAAAVASGTAHPLDARRGLHLQALIADAEAQLSGG